MGLSKGTFASVCIFQLQLSCRSGLSANPIGLSSAAQMSASIYQIAATLEMPTSRAITTDLKKDVDMNESDINVERDPAHLTGKHLEPSSRAHSESLRRVEGGVFNPAVTQRRSPCSSASLVHDGSMGIRYDKNPNYAAHHLLIACACGHVARKYREQRNERLSFQRNRLGLPLWLPG